MNNEQKHTDENKQPIDQQQLMLQLNNVEKKLADLKARWPFHSVQPRMVAEREDLEEERERLRGLLSSKIPLKDT